MDLLVNRSVVPSHGRFSASRYKAASATAAWLAAFKAYAALQASREA